MADDIALRRSLRRRRRSAPLGFWTAACAVAFSLSFGLGTLWLDKRADQDVWTTAMTAP